MADPVKSPGSDVCVYLLEADNGTALMLQLHRRDASLALSQQVQGQEPLGQRQLGAGKQGIAGQRCLIPAAVALQYSWTAFQPAMRLVATLATNKALRITPRQQRLFTLLFGAVVLHELEKAITLLELHFVLSHDAASAGSVCAYMLCVNTV